MLASKLKEKLRNREMVVGPMMMFDYWPGYLEIYKSVGMDFVMVDFEHGAGDLRILEELCRTGRLLDLPILVRPAASLYHLLRRYADMGPAGFIMPWVEREEQVCTVQEAIFCPPRGRRGPGGPSVLGVSSLERSGWDEVEENFAVIFQIESPAGIEAMETLAAPNWVDAVMLGPYDLSLNLDHCGQMDHPEVVAAIGEVFQKAQRLGKPCGLPTGDMEMARFWKQRGCHFFVCSEATVMVRMRAGEMVREIRSP